MNTQNDWRNLKVKYENLDVKPYQLARGIEKLNKYGMDVFEIYANENDFGFCDRNRVIAKCKLVYRRDDLREMPCPDRLKDERWRHYTIFFRYSDSKAMELIKRIDKSYETPFKPEINVNKLAQGAVRSV